MIEKVYNITYSDTKTVEMLISDENANYIHIMLS
jgi:hypothetical protein